MTNKEKLQHIRYALNLFVDAYSQSEKEPSYLVSEGEIAIGFLNDLIVEEALRSNGTNEIPY